MSVVKEIPFFPMSQQDPAHVPVVNFGEGNGSVIDPMGDKSGERVHKYTTVTTAVSEGKRPVPPDMWYTGLIEDMIASGYLPEHLDVYLSKPVAKYVQGYNPVSHYYINNRDELKGMLNNPDAGISSPDKIRIAGDRRGLLEKFRGYKMSKQIEASGMTVGIPGDLLGIEEMLHIIKEKQEGRMLDHPLLIENPVDHTYTGALDQLLRGFKFLDFDTRKETPPAERRLLVDLKALGQKYGIHISQDRKTTLEKIKQIKQKRPIGKLDLSSIIPDGSIIFVATGTMKKYDELVRICKEQGINIKVRSIYELVDTYVGPDEDAHTYQGNVAKKTLAAFKAWNSMSETRRNNMLLHNFPDTNPADMARDEDFLKKKCFIISEDSGFHFIEPNLVREPEFRHIQNMHPPGAPFPGVETGPSTLGIDGISGFMRNIQRIFERRREKHHADPDAHPDTRVVKKCLIALAPLIQEDQTNPRMELIGSEVHGHVTFEPRPPMANGNGSIEIDNYLIPNAVNGEKGQYTEAEMGEPFFTRSSPRAVAMKALAQEMQIPMGVKQTLEDDFSPEFNAGVVVDKHSYASKFQAQQFELASREQGFGVTPFSSDFLRAQDIQDEILAKSDGVVFAFDPDRAKEDFWRNLYLFTSMIVAEQTHDKLKFRKPFYLVNPETKDGGRAFDYLVNVVRDFHHAGTVAESPSSLYKEVPTVEKAIEGLREDRKHYRRFMIPQYATQEQPMERVGTDDEGLTKKFYVGVFCSASNKNKQYTEEARKYATTLIQNDFGIVSGGGCYASMGELTDAAELFRDAPFYAEHLTSSCKHIQPGEGDASQRVTQFQMARHIYERMEYMMKKSDAFTVMVGGTGTVQEFALLALLKKRTLEGDDAYAREMMQQKEIIIINSPMASDRSKGFYDNLKKIIDQNDPEACKKLGIVFVKSQAEAFEEMKRLRKMKYDKQGWDVPPEYANGNGHEYPSRKTASGGHAAH